MLKWWQLARQLPRFLLVWTDPGTSTNWKTLVSVPGSVEGFFLVFLKPLMGRMRKSKCKCWYSW